MNIPIFNASGEKTGDFSAPDNVWAVERHEGPEFLSTIQSLAGLRRGTACTKTRAECRGGGKKPWRQKGTGRARHGSRRSPLWRGGGVTFGPKPRSYSFSLNRKVRRLALFSALSAKLADENVRVLENVKLDEIKTKTALDAIGNNVDVKTLFVYNDEKNGDFLSALANCNGIMGVPVNMLGVRDILSCERLILTSEAAKAIEEVWS